MTSPVAPDAEPRPVSPTVDDPVVRGLSEVAGGPIGRYAGRHPWVTPLSILLAVTALTFALGMIQKAGCYNSDWSDSDLRYRQMCYSDLPYLYVGRGMVEHQWPYTDDPVSRDRYEVMEYPVGISYWAWGTAWVTQAVSGTLDDVPERAQSPPDALYGEVTDEVLTYVVVNSLGFAALALLVTWLMTKVNPGRPWDAAGFALAPTLALTGIINWDLLALVFVAGALWAFARDRPWVTGLMIGLGTATKLYPLFLLGGILIICLRRRELGALGKITLATAVSWLLANLPAMATSMSAWKVFWTFNEERGPDLGSIWMAVDGAFTLDLDYHDVNLGSWAFFVAWCVAVLVIGLMAPRTPRLAQLGFLIVVGFLLVNKVYSPQYVLWLLPLAVLARPRWRDLLVWQAGEVLYFACVWWYLGGFLWSRGDAGEQTAGFYWMSILIRICCQLYLAAVIVRDMYQPERDPVSMPLVDVRPGTGRDWWRQYAAAGQSMTTRSKDVAV